MAQPHPIAQLFGHRQHVPQGEDFQDVEVLVNLGLEQRLELMDPVLDLVLAFLQRLVGDVRWSVGGDFEADVRGVGGEEALFYGVDGFKGEFVDAVYDVVNESLVWAIRGIFCCRYRGKCLRWVCMLDAL